MVVVLYLQNRSPGDQQRYSRQLHLKKRGNESESESLSCCISKQHGIATKQWGLSNYKGILLCLELDSMVLIEQRNIDI